MAQYSRYPGWSIGQTVDAGRGVDLESESASRRSSDHEFESSRYGRTPEMGRTFRYRCYTRQWILQWCLHSNRLMISILFGYLHNNQFVRGCLRYKRPGAYRRNQKSSKHPEPTSPSLCFLASTQSRILSEYRTLPPVQSRYPG